MTYSISKLDVSLVQVACRLGVASRYVLEFQESACKIKMRLEALGYRT